MIELPTTTYFNWLSEFPKKNPVFKKLFEQNHPFFKPPIPFAVDVAVKKYNVHTSQSLTESYDSPHYETWKKIILENGDAEEIMNLTLKKE